MFLLLVFVVAVLSGATAAVAGFGIGSLLTPVLALETGIATAVAAVAVPHAAATALRCWRLRRAIDAQVLRTFGVLSAAGGLIGAALFARASPRLLTVALGLLLIATAAAELTGWTARRPPRPAVARLLGFLSGFFGGLAGNQGGFRAAALLSFRLPQATYVGTSTAVALLVDMVRTPIYIWHAGRELLAFVVPMSVAIAGVLVGTLWGERVLRRLPPRRFRQIVGGLIGALGIWLIWQTRV